jgi:hypothetical protein
MGFSSFLCASSGVSIPAYPWAEMPIEASRVAVVLPLGGKVYGVYDGYGRVDGVNVYDAAAWEGSRGAWDRGAFLADVRAGKKVPSFTEAHMRGLHVFREDYYSPGAESEVEPSPHCPWQGFFYPREARVSILETLEGFRPLVARPTVWRCLNPGCTQVTGPGYALCPECLSPLSPTEGGAS